MVSGGAEGRADKSTQAETLLTRLVGGKNNTALETVSGAAVVVDREGGEPSLPKPVHSSEGKKRTTTSEPTGTLRVGEKRKRHH